MKHTLFGATPDGIEVYQYTLTNANQVTVKIINYGGIITHLLVPDRTGTIGDIVLGFDNLGQYLAKHPCFGALVGRYANRIAKGKFTLGGREYTLAINNGPNHIHGGLRGFDKVIWKPEIIEQDGAEFLRLYYSSPDGEEGYPGQLDCTVMYSLNDSNELKIEYYAETNQPTPVNLTNHSYFNLNGQGNGDILDHLVQLNANHFTPVDKYLIPIGTIEPVENTPFDFRRPKRIGDEIDSGHPQIQYGGGYDHNFVINRSDRRLTHGGSAYDPGSGRAVEFSTTLPGVQFYCGNFLDGALTGKEGKVYKRRYGFCLETQYFPDSPNQPSFPSCIVEPGKPYHEMTIYKFTTRT